MNTSWEEWYLRLRKAQDYVKQHWKHMRDTDRTAWLQQMHDHSPLLHPGEHPFK